MNDRRPSFEADGPVSHRKPSVLIVDDEEDILESLRGLLEDGIEGVRVFTAGSGAAALEILAQEPVDLILTDYRMPGMDGLEFLSKARAMVPGVPRILVTAFPDLDLAIQAINHESIQSFFPKPLDPDLVIDTVRGVLYERRAHEMRTRAFARSLEVMRKELGRARP